MPSSWSPSLRFELQFTGENINLWGDKLNAVLGHADYAVAGWLTKALTADAALSTANAGDDEARAAMVKFTGAGPFTVTLPSVSKSYLVWNACSAAVTLTTGAGAVVVVDAGDIVQVACDGINVKTPGYGGYPLKDFIAASVLSATGSLPAATGNGGKYLYCDGTAWLPHRIQSADIGAFDAISITNGYTLAGSVKEEVLPLTGASIDVSTGEFFIKTISVNTSFSFVGATAGKAQAFILELTIFAGAIPTWPTSVAWSGGVAPTLPNGRSVISFLTMNGGTTWTGAVLALNAS